MDAVETGRITITRTLTVDDDLVSVHTDGDADALIIALGMLDLARDTLLHAPDEDDDDEA